jgi:type IV pilus assembly protein PilM
MLKIIDNFLNLFSGGNGKNSVLGIDVGSSSIKVVQIQNKNGKAVLQTYGEISLGPYANTEIGRATKLNPEKIAEALKDLLTESNVSTVDSAVSIPMRSSMVSVFKMPNMRDKQLSQMIPIEARKYIPVPISEVTLDWFVVPKVGESQEDALKQKFIEAMVVAIHNDVLNNFSTIVTNTQLNTSFFEIEMFSTSRSVLDTAYNMPVMIVDIGAAATKVYITERGVVRDSHIISRGSQNITLNASSAMGITVDYAEKLKRNYGNNNEKQDKQLKEVIDLVIDPIFSDANSILYSFQKKYNKNVSRVVLVGGGALLHGIEDRAVKKFGVEVILGDPFGKVEVPAFLMEVLKSTGLSFTVAIGLALRKLQELE